MNRHCKLQTMSDQRTDYYLGTYIILGIGSLVIKRPIQYLASITQNLFTYIQKASDVAGLAILAKKIGGKFGLKMAKNGLKWPKTD